MSNWWCFVLFKLFHSEWLAENVAQKELQRSWEEQEDLEEECDKGFDSINMIVGDTTNVNTGKQYGVMVRLQIMFNSRGHLAPQFISCQHHVLDRILCLVMEKLGASTTSPNIEYFFIRNLINNYETLKSKFVNGTDEIIDRSGWRDDMRFLYHLTRVVRFHDEHGRFPLVEFKKLLKISNACWNSRAILAILAFIDARRRLKQVCLFICTAWADWWFSDQTFRVTDFAELEEALAPYQSALVCLRNHWKQELSRIDIPHSNQCCERAVKVIQEVYSVFKDKSNVPLQFIVTNQHRKSSFFDL